MVNIMGMITVLCRVLLNSVRTELFVRFRMFRSIIAILILCTAYVLDSPKTTTSTTTSQEVSKHGWMDACCFLDSTAKDELRTHSRVRLFSSGLPLDPLLPSKCSTVQYIELRTKLVVWYVVHIFFPFESLYGTVAAVCRSVTAWMS
jgi:hypothetical protein